MKEPVFPHKDEILRTILNFVKPKAIILFGSRAKGIFSKHSDIDLFLKLDEPINFRTKRKLKEFIDLAAGIYSVDLVFSDEVDAEFERHIESTGVILWKR